jgi:hypothetical protein
MTNLLMDLDGLRAGRLSTTRDLDEPMPWVDPDDISAVVAVRLLAGDQPPATGAVNRGPGRGWEPSPYVPMVSR